MDYKNGRIYKITSDFSDKIYIGSTCQQLSKRMTTHRNSYKCFLAGKQGNMTSYELIKLGDAIIILIEDFPCEKKEQLHARERYYIELHKNICVNKAIPGRTQKEYHNDNKEKEQEYRKANKEKIKKQHQENKEQISRWQKIKITCECGSDYTQSNKVRHERTKKHQAYLV